MADLLDFKSTHCRELPTADQVWIQQRMSYKVQMALVSLAQHCAAVMARCSPDLTFNLWSV